MFSRTLVAPSVRRTHCEPWLHPFCAEETSTTQRDFFGDEECLCVSPGITPPPPKLIGRLLLHPSFFAAFTGTRGLKKIATIGRAKRWIEVCPSRESQSSESLLWTEPGTKEGDWQAADASASPICLPSPTFARAKGWEEGTGEVRDREMRDGN